MKLAKLLWSLGSLLVNVTIAIYVFLSINAPQTMEGKHIYINENWGIYELHWKMEFLFMTMIAIGAVYFAINLKKISWSIISVGQIILLLTYPVMLGGYRNTPFEIFEMANQIAIVIFVFGNIVFLAGLLHLYLHDVLLNKWLKYIAIALSGVTTLVFIISFAGIITWKQAIIIGPLINILYLINAYYGLKIKLEMPE